MDRDTFLTALDSTIARHALLEHPFYRAWCEAQLTRETLAGYSKQYFAHVSRFPTYVSAVHSNTDDPAARRLLLENLIEEEHGPDNHPELWLRFAEALGVARSEAESAEPLPETRESVRTMQRLTRSPDYVEGVAALYAYESQVPEIARTKREGLADHYGIDERRAVEYFTVHEEADVEHREAEREILARACTTPARQASAIAAADAAATALWTFLDGVDRAYRPGAGTAGQPG